MSAVCGVVRGACTTVEAIEYRVVLSPQNSHECIKCGEAVERPPQQGSVARCVFERR
jgi:hypothetical protein